MHLHYSVSNLVVSLRFSTVLQCPLQVVLQPLHRSAQVLMCARCLPLRPLPRLQLQLSLEEGRLQGQDLAVATDALCAGRLQPEKTGNALRQRCFGEGGETHDNT